MQSVPDDNKKGLWQYHALNDHKIISNFTDYFATPHKK